MPELLNGEAGLPEDVVANAFERLYGDPAAAPVPPKKEEDTGSETPSDTAEDEAEDTAQPDEDAETETETEETDEDEATDEGGTEDVIFTIEEDGTEKPVTRAEARNGYLRTADYTRKTQALAEDKRKFEAEMGPEKEAFRAERAKYVDTLAKLEQVMIGEAPEEPNWAELEASNPQEFARQYALWNIHIERVKTVRAERQAEEGKLQKEFAEQLNAKAEKEWELLMTARPEWKDESKRKVAMGAIADYAETLGFSRNDLKQASDHRLFILVEKAMLYDTLKKQIVPKDKTKEVKTTTTPTLKPGSSQTPTPSARKTSDLTRSKQRLAKTGSLHDAAAAFDLLSRK